MGIADERMVIPVVNAVRQRNQHRVFCAVHGTMGMDEINLLGHAQLTWVREGSISTEAVDPADFGYERGTLADIQGGSAQANAKRFMQTLRGHSQPLDHTLHWNTALILRVWNDKLSWIEALLEVQKVVSSGTALRKWESLKDV
jgi:anthranilate phosphoribosyltransferase